MTANAANRQLPVFVYGTLRPGQPNWERLLAGHSERVVAGRLPGAILLDCGHYPAAVERPGADAAGGAAGEVVWIAPAAWSAVLTALDHLEGFAPGDPDPLFDRVVRPVDTADGSVDCWVYLAGRPLSDPARAVVAGGDWAVHCAGVAEYHRHWRTVSAGGGRAAIPDGPDRGSQR